MESIITEKEVIEDKLEESPQIKREVLLSHQTNGNSEQQNQGYESSKE